MAFINCCTMSRLYSKQRRDCVFPQGLHTTWESVTSHPHPPTHPFTVI